MLVRAKDTRPLFSLLIRHISIITYQIRKLKLLKHCKYLHSFLFLFVFSYRTREDCIRWCQFVIKIVKMYFLILLILLSRYYTQVLRCNWRGNENHWKCLQSGIVAELNVVTYLFSKESIVHKKSNCFKFFIILLCSFPRLLYHG